MRQRIEEHAENGGGDDDPTEVRRGCSSDYCNDNQQGRLQPLPHDFDLPTVSRHRSSINRCCCHNGAEDSGGENQFW